jgi:hypothetical protein
VYSLSYSSGYWTVLTVKTIGWGTPVHTQAIGISSTSRTYALIPKNGMAPRTTSKYGEGWTPSPAYGLTPADGRLPYIFPVHQGEVEGNKSTKAFAPPNGCWIRLNMTEKKSKNSPHQTG